MRTDSHGEQKFPSSCSDYLLESEQTRYTYNMQMQLASIYYHEASLITGIIDGVMVVRWAIIKIIAASRIDQVAINILLTCESITAK